MRFLAKNLILALTVLIAATPLLAHSKLLSSKPSAGEIVSDQPGRIELRFSVKVQPVMSSIAAIDSSGQQITAGPLQTSDDGKTIWISLPDLNTGEYRVVWRALSADDHVINGDFTFRVQGFDLMQGTDQSPVSVEPVQPERDHSTMDHSEHNMEENVSWPQILIRWMLYAAMLLISGGLAFRLLVAGRAKMSAEEVDSFDRGFWTASLAGFCVLFPALLASLAMQTVAVFGSFDPGQAYAIVAETSFGVPWLLQLGAAVVTFGLLLVWRRGPEAKRTPFVWGALIVSLLMLLAPSLTGHAWAASAEYGLAIYLDWLHMAAAAVWIGGLMMIALGVRKVLSITEGARRASLLSETISRFNKFAIAATILLALTGIYNSWIHVESISALVSTLYGRVLLAKIGVTALMIALGGVNSYILHPRISAAAEAGDTADAKALFRNVGIEIALAVIVLLLAATLAFLPPAREHLPVAAIAPVH